MSQKVPSIRFWERVARRVSWQEFLGSVNPETQSLICRAAVKRAGCRYRALRWGLCWAVSPRFLFRCSSLGFESSPASWTLTIVTCLHVQPWPFLTADLQAPLPAPSFKTPPNGIPVFSSKPTCVNCAYHTYPQTLLSHSLQPP